MKGALSQRGARKRTKDVSSGSVSRKKAGTNWDRLRRINEVEIRRGIASDPDAQPTDANFWKHAKVVWPARKQVVTMRLDADLLCWFRQQRGYQTRINAILRAYMTAHAVDR